MCYKKYYDKKTTSYPLKQKCTSKEEGEILYQECGLNRDCANSLGRPWTREGGDVTEIRTAYICTYIPYIYVFIDHTTAYIILL